MSKIPQDGTCQGLGGILGKWDQVALCEHPICLLQSRHAWLAVAFGQLMAPCIAPLLLSHHVSQGWLSPASLLALHAMHQLRVPGGDGVSPPALLK